MNYILVHHWLEKQVHVCKDQLSSINYVHVLLCILHMFTFAMKIFFFRDGFQLLQEMTIALKNNIRN